MGVCNICPRLCGVDRENTRGYCGAEAEPRVARAALHLWEEPPISGSAGSGAIFFSGCNLRCVFCQNFEISAAIIGTPCDEERLCDLFFELEGQGAHNINLVTPTPHTALLRRAMLLARRRSFALPFVWNSNAYERVDVLRSLEGLVDIYLPDLKYVSSRKAEKYSDAPGYFDAASAAILEMERQVGPLKVNGEGLATGGLLIRHLVLPGAVGQARAVMDWVCGSLGKGTHLSLMRQYTPMYRTAREPEAFPLLARKLTRREYQRAVEYARLLGMENVYLQSAQSADCAFTPPFDGTGVD